MQAGKICIQQQAHTQNIMYETGRASDTTREMSA